MTPAAPEAGGRAAGVGARVPFEDAFDRVAWLLFGAGAALASVLLLWFGRDATFSIDEFVWLMGTPGLDGGDVLDPHNGHLIAVSRLLYKAILDTIGTDYLTFRLLTVGAAVIASALFFAYAGRRVGKLAAFAPAMLLLVFGSDYAHLLTGNGFTVLGALACGIGALLLLERDDRPGNVAACALLCLGVAIYTVALPFVAGVAVAILLRGDRWRRIWIAAVPALLYGAWWLYAQSLETGAHGWVTNPQSQTELINILTLPSWAFQSLAAMLGAVTGLDHDYGGDAGLQAGPTLALVAIVALGWRVSRGRVSIWLWGTLGIVVSLWVMGVLVAGIVRAPDTARYLFPLVISTFLVAAWAAAGVRWTRARWLLLYAVLGLGICTNIFELRNGGSTLGDEAEAARTQLGALELAGPDADPDLDLNAAAAAAEVSLPYTIPADEDSTPSASYAAFAARYGALGSSPEELREAGEPQRRLADSILIDALRIAPEPATGAPAGAECRQVAAGPALAVPPGEGVAISRASATGELLVGRFADTPTRAVGTIAPGQAQTLRFPADGGSDPWSVSASVPIVICGPA